MKVDSTQAQMEQKQTATAQSVFSFDQLNVKIIDAKQVDPRNLSAFDYQGIRWLDVARIPRELYIKNRIQTYQPHRQHNVELQKYQQPNRVQNDTYYQISKYYQNLKPKNTHFQIRDCIQVVSHHDVYYMGNDHLNHLSTLRETVRHFDLMNDSNVQDWDVLRNFRYSTFSVDKESFILGGFTGGFFYQNISTKKSLFVKNITENTTDPEGDTINYMKLYNEGNSKKLITAQNDRYVQIFDLEYYQRPQQRILCNNPVNIAKLNPVENNLLAVFADQNNPELIDLRSNQVIASLQGHQDFGVTLDWNPNGIQLCTGNQDRTARIWDMRNLTQATHILQSNMGNISQVKYDPTGSYLMSMECSDYLNIYDVFSNYQNFQVIDYVGQSTGFDIYQDKIYVGVHINEYNGILEIQKNKGVCQYQTQYEQLNI